MSPRRETLAFAVALAVLVGGFFAESLFFGRVLSPADVVFAQASFAEFRGPDYEPANRLLIDPVLQFQPWLEFNRAMLRRGRLPLWNSLAGCGAPHLANGQSAVFDPFHMIAYVGRLPGALAWMASARLWVAGLGMFLLARSWRLGPWGRWFAGLAFPFCGFLVVWLQYPVTSVAVWMPWLFLVSDRVLDRPGPHAFGALSLAAGFVLLGGHVQTSAHVLMAAGLYVVCRASRSGPLSLWERVRVRVGRAFSRTLTPALSPWERGEERSAGGRGLLLWSSAVLLGVLLAAIEVIPLGVYLSRSPVWGDRARERASAWAITKPRVLDAVCTALPYAFGSQRRGHPNLARALGVHNVNESAGGFAGLATALWLAPLAWSARAKMPRVRFLAGLLAVGAMGAFEVPPVANLLRAIPVLDVTDHRRLTLWVAFALALLGGVGLDHLGPVGRGRGWAAWVGLWVVGVFALVAVAASVDRLGPRLRARALEHYATAAVRTPGADAGLYRARADRQVRQALEFVPRYALLTAAQLLGMTALAVALRRAGRPLPVIRAGVLGLTLADLFAFGFGLNPAIAVEEDRPLGAVVAELRRIAPPPARIVGVGAELPPNTLMRYGLADCRNYDSVELARSLAWFEPLYDRQPGRSARTSRRTITWAGVIRGRERLREANVVAAVGASPPPEGAFERVERVGAVWIARLGSVERPYYGPGNGEIRVDARSRLDDRRIVPEAFDPGWTAEVDGQPAAVEPYRGTFLAVRTDPGARIVTLRYDPPEVRVAWRISAAALAATLLALVGVGGRGAGRKNVPEAWNPPRGRVRIEAVIAISPRPTQPASH
jgi:hypothetical protein